jgi:transcriptional regulator with XRE-family HTH domain
MKDDSNQTFGRRLAALRKARGLSQRDLAARVGISHRMIAYYEAQTKRPPAAKLPTIAKALMVSTDQLLGVTTLDIEEPQDSRLWKRLQVFKKLPPKAQRQAVQYVELLAKAAGVQDNEE